jgi:hypothetical protein
MTTLIACLPFFGFWFVVFAVGAFFTDHFFWGGGE